MMKLIEVVDACAETDRSMIIRRRVQPRVGGEPRAAVTLDMVGKVEGICCSVTMPPIWTFDYDGNTWQWALLRPPTPI
jgi:hypothetical protein